MAENTIDELMRRPATEWKGPKDPDLDTLILYLRQDRARADTGKRAKKTEVADEPDPELLKIVMEGRKVVKKQTFRRF